MSEPFYKRFEGNPPRPQRIATHDSPLVIRYRRGHVRRAVLAYENGETLPPIGWRRIDRVFRSFDSHDDDRCWEWAAITTDGYGAFRFSVDTRNYVLGAHRVVYQLLIGAIAPGLELDHLCRNPLCVNPAHMEPVPPAVNADRKMAANQNGKYATHCKHGHEFTEANIYRRPDNPTSRGCRTCRAEVVRRRYVPAAERRAA